MELRREVKVARLILGWTLETAALKASVGTQTWWRLENGKKVHRTTLERILKALKEAQNGIDIGDSSTKDTQGVDLRGLEDAQDIGGELVPQPVGGARLDGAGRGFSQMPARDVG